MEMSPRGGGNRLCEMLRYATGIDMITAITRSVVGDEPAQIKQKTYNGHWAEIILHTDVDGIFDGLQLDPLLSNKVIEKDIWVKPGDLIHSFEAANNAIGTLILRFDNAKELEDAITNQDQWLKICVRHK